MKALRIHVERVVRPIWASNLRKDRMREELLAHLTRLFEEELARSGDVESATAEAIHRFGDAATLTLELQASVPRLERWAFVSLPVFGPFRRRQEEAPLRYLLRGNCWGLAISIVAYSLFPVVLSTIRPRRPHRADDLTSSQLFIFLICTAAIQFATVIGMGLLYGGMRQELERRAAAATAVERRKTTWRIAGYAAAGSAVLGTAAAGMMLLIEAFLPVAFITRAGFWWIMLATTALGPLLTLQTGWSWKASTRRFENWESLDLDEHNRA